MTEPLYDEGNMLVIARVVTETNEQRLKVADAMTRMSLGLAMEGMATQVEFCPQLDEDEEIEVDENESGEQENG